MENKLPIEAVLMAALKSVLTVPDVTDAEAEQLLSGVLAEVEERCSETVECVRTKCGPLEEMGEGVEGVFARIGTLYLRMFEGLAIKGVCHAPAYGYTVEDSTLEEVPSLDFFSMQVEAWFTILRKITVVDMVVTNRLLQARHKSNMTQLDWFNQDDLEAIYKQTVKMKSQQLLGNLLNAAIVYTHCPFLEIRKKYVLKVKLNDDGAFMQEVLRLGIKSILEPPDLRNWMESMLVGVAQVDVNKIGSANPKLFENYRYSHKISFLCSKLIRDLTAILTESHLVFVLHESRAVEQVTNPQKSTPFKVELSQTVSKITRLAARVVSKVGTLLTLEQTEKQQQARNKEMQELENLAGNDQIQVEPTPLGKQTLLSMCLCPMLSMLMKISAIRGDSAEYETGPTDSGRIPVPTFLDMFVKEVVVAAQSWPTQELTEQIRMITDERNFGMDFWVQILALVHERVSWTILESNHYQSMQKVKNDQVVLHMEFLGNSHLVHLTKREQVDFDVKLVEMVAPKVEGFTSGSGHTENGTHRLQLLENRTGCQTLHPEVNLPKPRVGSKQSQ